MYDSNAWQLEWNDNATIAVKDHCNGPGISTSGRWKTYLSVIAEFCYISISTMSTCGNTNAYPVSGLARLALLSQTLASIFFNTVILSFGASKIRLRGGTFCNNSAAGSFYDNGETLEHISASGIQL